MVRYACLIKQRLGSFTAWKLEHIPRDLNEKANALPALAASISVKKKIVYLNLLPANVVYYNCDALVLGVPFFFFFFFLFLLFFLFFYHCTKYVAIEYLYRACVSIVCAQPWGAQPCRAGQSVSVLRVYRLVATQRHAPLL